MENFATTLIEAAIQAPSIHNTQPWLFRVHGTVIELRADRSRAVPAVDPSGRELVVSCGAALEQLVIAARAHGRDPVVRLLPDATDPDLLASVDIAGTAAPSADDRALYEAIPLRHTARSPFEERPIDADVAAALRAEVERAGASAAFLSRDDMLVTSVLLGHADAAERDDPAYVAELASWRKDAADDGIPTSSLSATTGRPTSLTLRDFDGSPGGDAMSDSDARDAADAPPEPVEYAAVVVIATPGDERSDWVTAGRALARLWLRATALGLVAAPLSQVVDADEYRDMLRRALRYQGFPQMVLRAGYGQPPAGTRRRPVGEVASET